MLNNFFWDLSLKIPLLVSSLKNNKIFTTLLTLKKQLLPLALTLLFFLFDFELVNGPLGVCRGNLAKMATSRLSVKMNGCQKSAVASIVGRALGRLYASHFPWTDQCIFGCFHRKIPVFAFYWKYWKIAPPRFWKAHLPPPPLHCR